MKIGIAFPYDARRHGGVQEFSTNLAAELARRGHDVTLIGPGLGEGSVENYRTIRCAAVPAFGSRRTPLDVTRLSNRQLQEVRSLALDALHVHEPLAPMMNLQLIQHEVAPVIATFHSAGPSVARTTAAAILRVVGGRVENLVKEFAAVSGTAAAWGSAYTCTTPSVISLATPTRPADHVGAPKSRVDAPLILYIGRNEPRKNVRVLVQAVGLLRRSGIAVRLVVAGWRSELVRSWAKDVGIVGDGTVRATGRISSRERDVLLAEADVFCSPASDAESFGLAPLEAHSSCVRLVLGDNPGYREAFSACPQTMFSEPGPKGLARALTSALSFPPLPHNHLCPLSTKTTFRSVVDEYERAYMRLRTTGLGISTPVQMGLNDLNGFQVE